MKKTLLTITILFSLVGVLTAETLVQNQSFEIDFENNSIPDDWNIPNETNVSLTNYASHGSKAAKFSSGYMLASQDIEVNNIAGKIITISIDAANREGARLGVILGYNKLQDDGSKKWTDIRIAWNRNLSPEYRPITLQRDLGENAKGPLKISFFRTNNQGTVLLDNVNLAIGKMTAEQKIALNRMAREWKFLAQRAVLAQKRLGENKELTQIKSTAEDMQNRCFAADKKILEKPEVFNKELSKLSARINKLLSDNNKIVISFSNPYTRLEPVHLPTENPVTTYHLVTLPGEYQAIGLDLTNCDNKDLSANISITGIDTKKFDCKVRQQVFLETWYEREKNRFADALPLLSPKGNSWKMEIPTGETAKLYIGLHVPRDIKSGTIDAVVNVKFSTGQKLKLPVKLQVVAKPVPGKKRFGYLACIYPGSNAAGKYPELTAIDLAEHGATMMEMPGMPKVKFTPQGEIATIDFSNIMTQVRAYAPHLNISIYWEGRWEKSFRLVDGTIIEPYTKQWFNAYRNLLKAYLDHMQKEGLGLEHFSIWADDEPWSKDIESSPDENMHKKTIPVFKFAKEVEPKLMTVLTITDYAFPADTEVLLPYVDVALPLWPYRTMTLKTQPPGYIPRQVYYKKILPMLKKWREETGGQIWNYHIATGKNDDVLVANRAHAVLSVGDDLTGAGLWAYNVNRGKTWDDTDGGLLDYSMIYDGTEDHPLNHKVNLTGEKIVPSIRWEALRAGIQDAEIMLYLKEVVDKQSWPMKNKIWTLLDEGTAMAVDIAGVQKNAFSEADFRDYDGLVTPESIFDYSQRLRLLYDQLSVK